VQAHTELTQWINDHPDEAQKMVAAELGALMEQAKVSPDLVKGAWKRLTFTAAIDRKDFEKFVKAAQSAGFLPEAGDLGRLVEVPQ
jgi:NitT/TauT family transport system substrate-binding protein